MRKFIPSVVFSCILAASGAAAQQSGTDAASQPPAAQVPPKGQPAVARGLVPLVPLKVQLIVSRYAGDKKVSSTPLTFAVVANEAKMSMRMTTDVPVPSSVFSQGSGTVTPSYSYRSLGTNIDCTAHSMEAGLFKLTFAISDSSLFTREKDSSISGQVGGIPAFRSFASSFNLLLKDGQTAQHLSATDAVSGEVLRIDVTLNVLK